MSVQRTDLRRTNKQNEILDLEKKYFNKIKTTIFSDNFRDDLLVIEREISDNYQLYAETWTLKNKLKVCAERLVRHYIYMDWHDEIEHVYPSPVSSDIGIKMSDAVICIDVKTIDIIGNSNDLKSTSTEKNQNSFNNKNYPCLRFKTNLKSIDHYSDKPVLTYVVKIVYRDDDYSFELSRTQARPTIVIVCIPNGELSNLFDYNIIDNFKTYEYFKENDGNQYTPYIITMPTDNKENLKAFLDLEFIGVRHYSDISEQMHKIAYYDVENSCVWWTVLSGRSKKVCAVKSGSSVRYKNSFLKERYDSSDKRWEGYAQKII